MFEFQSNKKKRILLEQELEAAKNQFEEEKKNYQTMLEIEKKKNQRLEEESNKLRDYLSKNQEDLRHLINIIKLERYRQEDELRKLVLNESISEEERKYRQDEIDKRFLWERKEAYRAIRKRESEPKKSLEVDRGMSR